MFDHLRELAALDMITISDVVRQMIARDMGLIPQRPTLLIDAKEEYVTE